MALAKARSQGYRGAMQGFRHQMLRFAPMLLLLALMGAGGRVIAPAGFMPGFGPDGPQLILCSGHSITLPSTGDHAPDRGMDNSCPFAIVALAGDSPPATPPALPIPARWTLPAAALPRAGSTGAGIGVRAQPATGPPRTA